MSSSTNVYAQLGQVGFEMVVPIVLGIGVDWLTTFWPWFTVIGAVGGFFLGIMHIISFQKKGRNNKAQNSGSADNDV